MKWTLVLVLVCAPVGLQVGEAQTHECGEWERLSWPPDVGRVFHGDGRFVSSEGFVSEDGVAWIQRGDAVEFHDGLWDGFRYVAVGRDPTKAMGPDGRVWLSQNAVNWELATTNKVGSLYSIAYSGERYVAVGRKGSLTQATDPTRWTGVHLDTQDDLLSVVWAGERFVAIGRDRTILVSETGLQWRSVQAPDFGVSYRLSDVALAGDSVIASGIRPEGSYDTVGVMIRSDDGLEWQVVSPDHGRCSWDIVNGGPGFMCLTWSEGCYYGCYEQTYVESSFDGEVWLRARKAGESSQLVSGSGRVVLTDPWATSVAGEKWSTQGFESSSPSRVIWDGERFVGVSWGCTQAAGPFPSYCTLIPHTSMDGLIWRSIGFSVGGINVGGFSLAADGQGRYVAVFNEFAHSSSQRREFFTFTKFGQTASGEIEGTGTLVATTWDRNRVVAVGSGGEVVTSADGVDWHAEATPVEMDLLGVATSGNTTVAVGVSGTVLFSEQPGLWGVANLPDGVSMENIEAVAYGDGVWIAVGTSGLVLRSENPDSWELIGTEISTDLNRLAWLGTEFVAWPSRGEVGTTYTSADGLTWSEASDWPAFNARKSVAGHPGLQLAGDWRRRCGSQQESTLLVPAAAHAAGSHGSSWRTDLLIHNPGAQPSTVEIAMPPGDHDRSVSFVMHGERSTRLPDVVERTLGSEIPVGPLVVTSDPPVLVTSRTSTRSEAGSYGQGIPAVASDQLLEGGQDVHLIQLDGSKAFRTNLGFVGVSEHEIDLDLRFFDADGFALGLQHVTVVPDRLVQLNDVLAGFEGVAGAYATLLTADSDARYTAYSSVVDNASGDAVYAGPVELSRGERWIPIAAHSDGVLGSRWRTDLELFNPSSEGVSLVVELLPAATDNSGATTTTTIDLGPGQSQRFRDVIEELFEFSGLAALRIVSDGGEFGATSRTYTDVGGGAGSYGQGIPSISPAQFATYERNPRLFGLRQTTSPDPATRTNLGVVNPDTQTLELVVTLYHGEGSLIGSRLVAVPPRSVVQVSGVLEYLGVENVTEAFAVFDPPPTGREFFAYASVIDSQSGDPVYLPILEAAVVD